MNDLAVLVQMAVVFAATVIPLVVLIRFVDGSGTDAVGGLFDTSRDLPWPKGVQEEEPQRWAIAPSVA